MELLRRHSLMPARMLQLYFQSLLPRALPLAFLLLSSELNLLKARHVRPVNVSPVDRCGRCIVPPMRKRSLWLYDLALLLP